MSNLILPAVLGLMMAYIAYRQWKTSHDTFNLAMYDRRFKVYANTIRFVAKVQYVQYQVFRYLPDLKQHLQPTGYGQLSFSVFQSSESCHSMF